MTKTSKDLRKAADALIHANEVVLKALAGFEDASLQAAFDLREAELPYHAEGAEELSEDAALSYSRIAGVLGLSILGQAGSDLADLIEN